MRINTSNRRPITALLFSGLMLGSACERATPSPEVVVEAAPASAATAPAAPAAKPSAALATLREDVPLPLTSLLGHPIEEVQAQLGEHEGKGMLRKSCFRFAPARTHFTCRYGLQSYADRTGNFRSVRVAYEDGIASAVAYDGWLHGSGSFTPEALLDAIGLRLPGPGQLKEPAPGVRLWTWFNSQARLLIAERQYRVEVSIVDEDWARSRVEVILNHPLTPEQQARVVTNTSKTPAESLPAEPAEPAP